MKDISQAKRRSNFYRRTVALVTAIALCICGTMLCPDEASAKAKAKKLSSTSVTIAMGGTQTVSLNSGSGQWDVAEDSIVDISTEKGKSVTVTPENAGKTTLTCSVGGKTLSCSIKVLNNEIGAAEDERPFCITQETLVCCVPDDLGEREITNVDCDSEYMEAELDYNEEYGTYVCICGHKLGLTFLTYTLDDGSTITDDVRIVPWFRENKAKKTTANYNKWRKSWIQKVASQDMTTWEIIDAIGYLISNGSYSSKGGTTALQLWYGGNGTCISGAKMMNDFMHDLGINSKVRFAGNDGMVTDIYGYTVSYSSQHRNTQIKLGGKTYRLNPQPEMQWPMGIIQVN